jgi:hypothetical protein
MHARIRWHSHPLFPPHVALRQTQEDGLITMYETHEDSVYCAEWSSADPWLFASVSFDGRFILNHVPRETKFSILL